MDIHEIRRRNLKALIGERFSNNRSAFGEVAGMQSDYVSRLLSGKPPSDGGKNLGESLARSLETKLHLTPGWLDRTGDAPATVGDEPPPLYGIPRDPADPAYYPALIAHRVRHWDARMQLMLAEFIETMNRAMGDTPKGNARNAARRPRKAR